jgi:tripartite-type tricarboxylate transporter receptor subunit TctC
MKAKELLTKIAVSLFILAAIPGCNRVSRPASSVSGGTAPKVADKYPDRPITLIIAQSAGGATEAGARVWQPFVEKELGVPLNFEFKPGANGQIGLTVLANATPDGYTLGCSDSMSIATTMNMQDPEYKMETFCYLVNVFRDPGVIMAHKDEPYNTLSELLAYAKTKPPESLTVGVAAMNDLNTIALRQFEEATGVDLNIVNFNGGGKARTALAGHQIELGAFMYYGSRSVKEETKILSVSVAKPTVSALLDKETTGQVAGKVLDDIFSFNQIMAPVALKEQHPERYQFVIDAFKRAFTSPEFKAHLEKLDQVDWLNPLYGDENDALNEYAWEFGSRIAPLLAGN